MNRTVHLPMRDLLDHVTCKLCGGYYVDATTVVECLHSFCRTCIVQYLADHRSCPVCEIQIHKTRPLLNIKHDQTLQDIVYTLVPGLRKNEMKRRKDFWEKRDDIDSWKHLTLEELGEWDEHKTSWKKKSKKICLSIEPSQLVKSMLSTNSEWREIDKPIAKRYIRCSQDVTVHHLHKFLKFKLNEEEEVEVLLFHKSNILQESFTLAEVLETFPCKFNEMLDLTYAIYVMNEVKEPALQIICNSSVPAQKKRRLPSATPQLQAFFNSQLQPRVAKGENQKTPVAAPVDKQLESRKDLNPISDPIKPMSILPMEPSLTEKDEPTFASPSEVPAPNDTATSPQTDEAENKVQSEPKKVLTEEKLTENNCPLEPEVPSKLPPVQPIKKHCEPVQCYQMRTIPVSEAVLSKPPTPVETATVYQPKAKRASESKSNPVDHSEASGVKPPKSRRKATTPVHHSAACSSSSPKSSFVPEKDPTPRTSPSAQSGKFILLSPQHSNIKVTPAPGLISNVTSGSGSSQCSPPLPVVSQVSNLAPFVRTTNSQSLGTVTLQSFRPSIDPKQPLSASREASLFELTKRARDVARNVMHVPKRPPAMQRPILPKTSNSPTPVRQSIDGVQSDTVSVKKRIDNDHYSPYRKIGPPSKSNTVRPKKVYQPKPFRPKIVPFIKPKKTVSPPPLTTLSKPPREAFSQQLSDRAPDHRLRASSSDQTGKLLEKLSAAVAKSNEKKQLRPFVVKSGPPPPYPRSTSSVVFSGASNRLNGPRRNIPNTSNFNLSKPATSPSTSTNHMFALAHYQPPHPSMSSRQQSPSRLDVFNQPSRTSAVSSSKKQQVEALYSGRSLSNSRTVPPQMKKSKCVEDPPNLNQLFSGFTGYRKGRNTSPLDSRQDGSRSNAGSHARAKFTSAPATKPRDHFPLNRQVERFESSKWKLSQSIVSGTSGSIYHPPTATFPTPSLQSVSCFPPPTGSSGPTRSVFARSPPASPGKRPIYQSPNIFRPPPVGTKSPWTSRGAFMPPVEDDLQLYPPIKKPCFSSPQPSDAIPPSSLTTSGDVDNQPLELTVRPGRAPDAPIVTSQSGEQPLCLIVKK